MRVKNNCLKLLLSGVGALLLECTLHAEISVLSTPSSGFGEMSLGISYPRVWRDDAKSPNYVAKVALPAVDYTGPYSGRADASNYSVSGSISCTDNPSQRGSSSAGDTVNLYADAVPSSNILVKFQSNLSVNWVGTNLNTGAGFSFSAIGTEDKGSAISRQPTSVSPLSENKSWAVAVKAAATSDYAPGGKPYYKLGTFSVTGGAEIFNPNTNAGYSSKVTDVKAYYIGNELIYSNGDNQTWVVDGQLPLPLSVKVADGETGKIAPNVDITFTVRGPSNEVISQGTAKTGQTDGIAQKQVTLGAIAGTYKITAACPAAVCTSGAKEFTFTGKAVSRQEATKLTEMFCDGSHFYGQKLKNPLRVKALNLYTTKGEAGFAVTFTHVGVPQGTIHAPSSNTDAKGLAKTDYTLGGDLGVYTVKAHCEQCLQGKDVSCIVKSIPLPNSEHDTPSVDMKKRKRGVNLIVAPGEVYPQGAGGAPISAQVTITGASKNTSFTAQVVAGANTGGHQHDNANRPKGTLTGAGPTSCTSTPPTITCATDGNGYAQLGYTSSEVGGWDNILVKMNSGEEGDAIVKVRVPDLRSYPRSALNHISASNTEKVHANYLYGTQTLNNIVDLVASQYKASMSNLAIISVNDMSLINGGLMDICANWNSTAGCNINGNTVKGHVSHRKGTSVDINSSPRHPTSKLPVADPNFVSKLTELFRQQGCGKCPEEPIHYECPKTVSCP